MTSHTSEQPVIVVTGASRGIGAATARLAGARGYAVCVNFRSNAAAAEGVVADIGAAGGRAVAVAADVGQEADVLRLFEEVDSSLGSVSALVNNAGLSGGRSRVEDMSAERLQEVFATNVQGTFLCAREAVRRMSMANGGSGGAIVNVSSQAAVFGGVDLSHYAASKAAVNTFTLGFAREAAKCGVRVNAVSPGVIATDQLGEVPEERITKMISEIPLGHVGHPDNVAEAILWLLSDAASYVTGTVLPVNGGR